MVNNTKKVLVGIDIARDISELLYDHDSVIIPDLGGIVSSFQSASIDHVQGLLHPPSKKLTFNENFLINDGLLVDCIKRKNNISLKESVDLIGQFVVQINEKLNKKEIVILPQIGRLYKDYKNGLRFLQDTNNFNTDVFGLPTLQYYPVLRSQEPPVVKKIKPIKLVSGNKDLGVRSSFSKKIASIFLPLFLGLVVIAFAIGLYKNQGIEKITDATIQKIPVNENRVNKKPSMDNMSFYNGLSGDEKYNNIDIENDLIKEPEESLGVTRENPIIPQQENECIIIIGVFSKKSGVEKRVKDIYDLGYDAYQDKKGALTRVGVLFGYEEENEIKNMLKAIRAKFDPHAWILEE